jgi:cyclophilin family peptidyl-prolyl cis-trans isomerase
VGALLALIFGIVALSTMKRDPALGGRGIAIAGTVLGAVGLVVPLAALAVVAIASVSTTSSGGSADSVIFVTSSPRASAPPTTREGSARSTGRLPVTVPGATLTGDTPCPAADGSTARAIMFAKPPPMCIDATKTYTAKIATSKGDITIALAADKAPQTVNNFVVLARYHYFDNTICHRIIQGFVVQCGDPTGSGAGPNPGYSIPDELPTTAYAIGDLAMANTGTANTGGSQFFIISGANGASLPLQYSYFGKVTTGLDTTVTALDAVHGPDPNSANGDAGGVPTAEQVVISTVTITES